MALRMFLKSRAEKVGWITDTSNPCSTAAWGKVVGAESIVGNVQEESDWPSGTYSEEQNCKQ